MRNLIMLVVSATLLLSQAAPTSAVVQTQTNAQEKAASLRAQLSDVETKQAELQTRLQNLDEQLKPENIDKSFAGVGSTHPEDLREQRRRQLEIERNGMQKQLDLLSTSHARLATALAQADAEAYRQSAAPVTNMPNGTSVGPSTNSPVSESAVETNLPTRPRHTKKKKAKRRPKIQNRSGSDRPRNPRRTNSAYRQLILRPVATAPGSDSLRSSRGDGGISVVPFAVRDW